MLLFLTEHDFANSPQAAGWYSYSGAQLRATLWAVLIGADIGRQLFAMDQPAGALNSVEQRVLETEVLEQGDNVREPLVEGGCIGTRGFIEVLADPVYDRVGGLMHDNVV